MAEYSSEDADRAHSILEQLFDAEGTTERRTGKEIRSELPDNLGLFDVQSNVGEFGEDIRLSQDFNLLIPAFEIHGDNVPVSLVHFLTLLGGPPVLLSTLRVWGPESHLFQYLRGALQPRSRDSARVGFNLINGDEAKSTFYKRAVDFVATRIAGIRILTKQGRLQPFAPPQPVPGLPIPGCDFTVTTNTQGLRVFWSGAYYVVPNYFNAPTSPTSKALQSGTYIFGVDGGTYGNKIQWDKNAVISLPGSQTHVHLNY